jgi:hypothetical protein
LISLIADPIDHKSDGHCAALMDCGGFLFSHKTAGYYHRRFAAT